MELLRRALPFVIPLELLELIAAYFWPESVSQTTYWGLVAGAPAFLFLNAVFAPATLRPCDTRPWLRETVPAFWVAMVIHATVTSAVSGTSLRMAAVALLVQAMTMLVYISLMVRVPTLPSSWRRLPVMFIWWLVANLVVQGLWQEGVNVSASTWAADAPELQALFGGLTTLLYGAWNLVWIGLAHRRQLKVSGA